MFNLSVLYLFLQKLTSKNPPNIAVAAGGERYRLIRSIVETKFKHELKQRDNIIAF
jgi:hypothetical protein